jgi:hypothetical protein
MADLLRYSRGGRQALVVSSRGLFKRPIEALSLLILRANSSEIVNLMLTWVSGVARLE